VANDEVSEIVVAVGKGRGASTSFRYGVSCLYLGIDSVDRAGLSKFEAIYENIYEKALLFRYQ
jgi:hypothetical protein